jgi:hypothetical protein
MCLLRPYVPSSNQSGCDKANLGLSGPIPFRRSRPGPKEVFVFVAKDRPVVAGFAAKSVMPRSGPKKDPFWGLWTESRIHPVGPVITNHRILDRIPGERTILVHTDDMLHLYTSISVQARPSPSKRKVRLRVLL